MTQIVAKTGNKKLYTWASDRIYPYLECKAKGRDVEVLKENEWNTSKAWSKCGDDTKANAAWNILSRGLEDVRVGYSESTPVETALPVDTPVSAKRIVEAGSPTLKERTASAVSE